MANPNDQELEQRKRELDQQVASLQDQHRVNPDDDAIAKQLDDAEDELVALMQQRKQARRSNIDQAKADRDRGGQDQASSQSSSQGSAQPQ